MCSECGSEKIFKMSKHDVHLIQKVQVEVEVVVVMVMVDLRDFQEEEHPKCSQAKGSKVEERLVHLRMEVKFEVLIEKKKMYYLGLRRFDLWMEFLMVHLEELEMRKWW
ncbi:hypothetical protein Tco_0193954 [Tanacetum coccineum]